MLSTNSTSSIQKRRQFHRRQQSLEVPTLATPLPANPRRPKPAAHSHRRGLSLDQSLSVLNSPTGFRPLLPQDHNQDQDQSIGSSPVRIQLDHHTNIAHPPEQQHFVQETQQHRPAQPGYQAQDFQSHLQQQLNGNVTHTNIVAPIPTHTNQEQALQDLQQHLEWYQQRFGHSPSPNPIMQSNTNYSMNTPIATEINANLDAMRPAVPPQQYIVAMPQTSVPHGHSHTVPNTPQQYVNNWPSPPATDMKHVRSQSFQLDVAPMPSLFNSGQIMGTTSPYTLPQDSFNDSFVNGDQAYASSVYSSSNVDPMSPSQQYNTCPMPTLFEEEPTVNGCQTHSHSMGDDTLLLQAAAGASDDFNSPNFIIGAGLPGVSPHSQMMNNFGEDVNATIIDTGVQPEEVDRHISEQDPESKWWMCLYLENGKKCGQWFKRKENARSHVQNHLGDRQFQCNDCGKTFVRQHDMKRHAAIHKDDRPHICPCGSKFARHDALTRHRQRGMCNGALPGYEKSEEEKPKRGRPKKHRPDPKSRTAKANKARQIDRENDTATLPPSSEYNYASPSSGMSDHSLPMTPPDTSDFDADAFINMANVDIDYGTATSSWRDTPPTSPVSSPIKTISPAMLNKHTTGTISPSPGVAYHQASLNRAMTPDASNFGSSPYTNEHVGTEVRQVSWSSVLASHDPNPMPEPESMFSIGSALEHWLSTH